MSFSFFEPNRALDQDSQRSGPREPAAAVGTWAGDNDMTTSPAMPHRSAAGPTEAGAVGARPALSDEEAGEAAQLEADRAGEHMNSTADRARAVDYQPGSVEMAQFAAAEQLYRHARRRLEAQWDRCGRPINGCPGQCS